MKIAVFHNGNDGVSHYRLWQPARWLKENGVEIKRLKADEIWSEMPVEKLEEIRDWADILWFGYAPGPKCPILMTAMNKTAEGVAYKPLVVDIDDNITALSNSHHHYETYARGEQLSRMYMEVKTLEEREQVAKLQEAHKGTNLEFAGKIVTKGGKDYHVSPDADPKENVFFELREASMVTTTTEYLKGVYRGLNQDIEILPNGIDFKRWPKSKSVDDGYLRIGLIGSINHIGDWDIVHDALVGLLEENPKVKLVMNGFTNDKENPGELFCHPAYEHLRTSDQFELVKPCKIQDYAKWLTSLGLDIGLAPLTEDKFNNSKSNLKYLEYGAMGIPCVFSYVEAYKHDIKNGENGFTAKPHQFKEKIEKLIKDKDLREKMGREAHKDVKERYSMDVIGPKYIEAFEKAHDYMRSKFASSLGV